MDKQHSLLLLTPPQKSVVLGTAMIGAGSILATSGLVDFVGLYPTHQSELAWLAVLFFVVLGITIIMMGLVLLRPKGGATIDQNDRTLKIFGDKPSDFATIPLEDIAYLRTQIRTLGDDTETIQIHSAEAMCRNGACVVLFESTDHDDASGFVQKAAEVLHSRTAWPEPVPDKSIPSFPDLKIETDPNKFVVTFRAGFRWSLGNVLLFTGIATIFLGLVMLVNVPSSPLMGFLVGPPLFVFGAVLTTLSVGKSFGRETLHIDGHGIFRRILVAGQTFGEWSLNGGGDIQPYARLRPMGAKGLGIEFVNAQKTYYAAVGTNRRTHSVDSLSIVDVVALLNAEIRSRLTVNKRPESAS